MAILTRRNFLQMSAGLAGAALLAACGGTATTTPTMGTSGAATGGSPAAGTPRKASGNVRYLLRAGSADETKLTQEFLDKNFTPQSGVKVTVEPTDATADEKLTAAMIGSTAQDVFDTWTDNVTQYSDRGQVLDVDPLVQRDLTEAETSDFFASQWKDFKLASGIRFGMPKLVNIAVVYYNLDLFEKAGLGRIDDSWDHDKYADAARKLTQGGTVGLFLRASELGRWWYKLGAWGGSLVDPNDNTKAAFDSPEALAALEWSRKLIFDDKAMGNQADLVGVGQRAFDAIPAAFGAGKIAMVEDGFYPFTQAKAINKNFRWAYAPVPKGPKARTAFGSTDGFAIWKGTKNQDGAWELVKYLSGKDFQVYLTQITGYFPSRTSAIAGWKQALTDKYPELAEANIDVIPQALQQGYPAERKLFKKDAEYRQIITPALQKVFLTGTAPVSSFTEVAAQVTAKMRS
jgi:multiple sugar transport system substrate-binding protein